METKQIRETFFTQLLTNEGSGSGPPLGLAAARAIMSSYKSAFSIKHGEYFISEFKSVCNNGLKIFRNYQNAAQRFYNTGIILHNSGWFATFFMSFQYI